MIFEKERVYDKVNCWVKNVRRVQTFFFLGSQQRHLRTVHARIKYKMRIVRYYKPHTAKQDKMFLMNVKKKCISVAFVEFVFVTSDRSRFGHLVTVRRGLLLSVQHVLDLLQRFALGVGQHVNREQQSEHAKAGVHPKYEMLSDGLAQGVERLGQDEAQEPAEAGRQPGSHGLEVSRKYLAHDGPRQRTETWKSNRIIWIRTDGNRLRLLEFFFRFHQKKIIFEKN